MKKIKIRWIRCTLSLILSASMALCPLGGAFAAELPAESVSEESVPSQQIDEREPEKSYSEVELLMTDKTVRETLDLYFSNDNTAPAYHQIKKLTLKTDKNLSPACQLSTEDITFIKDCLISLTALDLTDVSFSDEDTYTDFIQWTNAHPEIIYSYTEPIAQISETAKAAPEAKSQPEPESEPESGFSGVPAAAVSDSDHNSVYKAVKPSVTVTVVNSSQASITLNNAQNIPDNAEILFPVWGNTNGQNDIHWYKAVKKGTDTWTATINIADHKETGTYNVHVYQSVNNNRTYLTETTFNVTEKYSGKITVKNQDNSLGTFTAVLSDAVSTLGISKLSFAVWGLVNGQNDLHWYTATKDGDTWTASIDYLDHKSEKGTYAIHAYITDVNGKSHYVTETTTTVTADSKPVIHIQTNQDQTQMTINFRNYSAPDNHQIMIAVWGSVMGQNDLKWYKATKQNNGSYTLNVDIINQHKECGEYNIHVYDDGPDSHKYLTETTYQIQGVSISGKITIKNHKPNYGTCRVIIPKVSSPAAVTKVRVPVWSKNNGQDDIIWYDAKKSDDGTWYLDLDIAKHGYETGTYAVHAYGYDNRGISGYLGETTVDFQSLSERSYEISKLSSDAKILTITLYNMKKDLTKVEVPVWGEPGWQNDLVWYNATKINDTTWQVKVPLEKHMEVGTYNIHVYTSTTASQRQFLFSTSFEVNRLPGNRLTISENDSAYGSFRATLVNAYSTKPISAVKFAVWTEKNGQDDLTWVDATKNGADWSAKISSDFHNLESGKYNVHVYIKHSDGTQKYVTETIVDVVRTIRRIYQNPSGYYQIKDSITLTGGGYNLSYGYEGLKVKKVVQYFGINNGVGMGAAIYGPKTQAAVKNFQRNHGLPATGVVDLATWRAMGFSDSDWYGLSTYVHPKYVGENGTRSQHIEAMIAAAYDYLGDPYVIGASGAPGLGLDCSGLAMQALYGAGLYMDDITPVTHAMPGHEYESRNMWNSSRFMHVSYAARQRGDLIFYQNSSGTVIHVAIYLGNNMVIDSWPNRVAVVNVTSRGSIKGVARPFI